MSETAPVASAVRQQPRGASRVLNLTFDDGPDPVWTLRVLEQLERCRAAATFFVVGERALLHPHIAEAVLAGGHDVQLHCHRHVRHSELTEGEIQLDAESALAVLARHGVRPLLWRTPWGICTEASINVARRLGLRLVRWAIDTHDWRGDRAATMLARSRAQLADGGPVLMHDANGPGARRAGAQNTVELVVPLASAARALGLRLAPMGDDHPAPAASELARGARA